MAIKITETFSAELLAHLMIGLQERLHADFKNENPDPRLRQNYTATGAEAVIEYKGQFYKITVDPEVP